MHEIKQLSDKRIKPDLLDNFLNFINNELELDTPYSVYFIEDKDNASEALGKTAMYNPSTKSVYVYVTNRHPKDIFRSIAHELVHHKQHCNGELENMSLEKAEIDANAGGYYLRKFEDQLKENKLQEETKKCLPGFTLRSLGKIGDTSSEFCLPSKLNWKNNMDRWSVDDILAARFAIWEDDFSGATDRKQGYQIKKPNPIKKDWSSLGLGTSMFGPETPGRRLILAIDKKGTGRSKHAIKKLILDPLLIYKVINMFSSLKNAGAPSENYIKQYSREEVDKFFTVLKEPKKGEKDYKKKMQAYKNYEKLVKVSSAFKEYYSGDYFKKKKANKIRKFRVNEQEGGASSQTAPMSVSRSSVNPVGGMSRIRIKSEPARRKDRGSYQKYTPEQLQAAQAIYRASGIGGGEVVDLLPDGVDVNNLIRRFRGLEPELDPEKKKEFLKDPEKFRKNLANVDIEEAEKKYFRVRRKKSEDETKSDIKRFGTSALLAQVASVDLPPELIEKFAKKYSQRSGRDNLIKKATQIYSVSPLTFKSDVATREAQEQRDMVFNIITLASMMPFPLVAVLDAFLAIYYFDKYFQKNKPFKAGDIIDDTDLQLALVQSFVSLIGTKGLLDAKTAAEGSELFGSAAKLNSTIDAIKRGAADAPVLGDVVKTAVRLMAKFRQFGQKMSFAIKNAKKTEGSYEAVVVNQRLVEPALENLAKIKGVEIKKAGELMSVAAKQKLSSRLLAISAELTPLFIGQSTRMASAILKRIDFGYILRASKDSAVGRGFRKLIEGNIEAVKGVLDKFPKSNKEFLAYLKKKDGALFDRVFKSEISGVKSGARARGSEIVYSAGAASTDDVTEAFIYYMQMLAEKNPALLNRLMGTIYRGLRTEGFLTRNAAALGAEELMKLALDPTKRRSMKLALDPKKSKFKLDPITRRPIPRRVAGDEAVVERINELTKQVLEGEKRNEATGEVVKLTDKQITKLVEELLELKGYTSNGKLTESAMDVIASSAKSRIDDVIKSGSTTLTATEKSVQDLMLGVQDRVFKLFLSNAVRKFGVFKGVPIAASMRNLAIHTDKLLSPDAFYMTGAGSRLWVRYVMGNRPLKNLAKATPITGYIEKWLSFVIFKSLLPLIFYSKVYGPNCKISFQQYMDLLAKGALSWIGSKISDTTYDISTARKELNTELAKYFDEKEPPAVSIQKLFPFVIKDCKHVRDLVQTGTLEDTKALAYMNEKLLKLKMLFDKLLGDAERRSKIAAKNIQRELDTAIAKQVGEKNWRQKAESIKEKMLNGQDITEEEKKFIEKLKKVGELKGDLLLDKLRTEMQKLVKRVAPPGNNNTLDPEKVKADIKAAGAGKPNNKKPSRKRQPRSNDLEKLLEKSITRKKSFLSERLIKVSIG